VKKRLIRVALPVAALVLVVVWLVASGRIGGRHKDPNLLTLYGNVDIRQVELGFRVPGRVLEMKLEEGAAVDAGTPLARLDPRTYQQDVQSAEAQVAQQVAMLDRLQRGPRPAEIAGARATLAERQAAVDDARRTFARASQLLPDHAITRAGFDSARAAKQRAEAAAAAARESLRLLEEGTRAEDIAAGRANLEAAQARLAQARTALADTQLLAPSGGVVLSRVREPGAIVSPAEIVYVLSLTRPVWVRAYVAEPALGRIHPGMEVSVASDTTPGRSHSGRIGFVSPMAEFTPKSVETPELRTDLVYRLRIIVDDVDPGLRQGMPVTVRVRTAPASPAAHASQTGR
jgi:HlyD family secretion protein